MRPSPCSPVVDHGYDDQQIGDQARWHRNEHRRWSLHPAIARVFLTLFAPPGTQGPPPVFVAVPPGFVADLLIVVAMIYDWRTRGRPHHVYVYGGLTLLADQLVTVPVSTTQTWMSIARFLEGLAG